MSPEHPFVAHILTGLSIHRWNTFPRLRTITALDHLSFVAHIGLLLIDILEEKDDIRYDRWVFLRKVLFSGFFTFIYSDINSEVKDRIAERDPEMYDQLESQVWNEIENLDIGTVPRHDIEKIRDTSPEDILLSFAKNWASYYEVYNNSLVYPDAYAPVLKNIVKKWEQDNYRQFLKYLDFDPHNQTDDERYLLVIHRLASSYRWNRSVRRYPVSVLSHTYIIAFFTYIEAQKQSLTSDEVTDMLLTAFFHDIPEAITGDIITPTKKSLPWLVEVIEWIEEEMISEYLLSYIAQYRFHEKYAQKMLRPWQEPYGSIVKQADHLSAYHEALLEAPYSDEFSHVVKTIAQSIEK